MVKQTAGRDALNDFAPKFAELNDDVLFGEVWSREGQLPLKLRSIVTITALISKGITDSSLTYHLTTAKQNGVTKTEMAELLTHLAFYAGWPNAWAAFRQAKEVYADESADANGGLFGLGAPNTAYAQYFTGESFLNPLTDPTKTVFLANVTFSPACRNNWHILRQYNLRSINTRNFRHNWITSCRDNHCIRRGFGHHRCCHFTVVFYGNT